jgi:hypothetical protein
MANDDRTSALVASELKYYSDLKKRLETILPKARVADTYFASQSKHLLLFNNGAAMMLLVVVALSVLDIAMLIKLAAFSDTLTLTAYVAVVLKLVLLIAMAMVVFFYRHLFLYSLMAPRDVANHINAMIAELDLALIRAPKEPQRLCGFSMMASAAHVVRQLEIKVAAASETHTEMMKRHKEK